MRARSASFFQHTASAAHRPSADNPFTPPARTPPSTPYAGPPPPSRPTPRPTSLPTLKSQPAVMLSSHLPHTPSLPPLRPASPTAPPLPHPHSAPRSPPAPPQLRPSSSSLTVARPLVKRHSVRLPHPFSCPISSASPPNPVPSNRPHHFSSNNAAHCAPNPEPVPAPLPTSLELRQRLRFRPGDIVLCRYFNYPVWPATIALSHQSASRGRYFTMRPTRNGDDAIMAYWVLFSGENLGGWVRTDCVVPYHPIYAQRIKVSSALPIFEQLRVALNVAAQEYTQSPSPFEYDEADFQLFLYLCSIPINEYVDIKSQDSQVDRESDPNNSNEQISSPEEDNDDSDSDNHSFPSERPVQRRSGDMTLRPRQPKRELHLHTSRVLRSRSDRLSTVVDEDAASEEEHSLYIPVVKREPTVIIASTSHDDIGASVGHLGTQEDNVHQHGSKPWPRNKKQLQPVERPIARRRRGRPRKHPLPRSRVTKREPAVAPSRTVKREPLEDLTYIPLQISPKRQFRRKKRGRPRKSAPPPEPTAAEQNEIESKAQDLQRLQRRLKREEKKQSQSGPKRTNAAAQGSSVGHGSPPSIALLTRTMDPAQIRAQSDRLTQRLFSFRANCDELVAIAEKVKEAQKRIEESWKAVVEEGRHLEAGALDMEAFLANAPTMVQFLRSVRM